MKKIHTRKTDEKALINFIKSLNNIPDDVKNSINRLQECIDKELIDYSRFENIEEK